MATHITAITIILLTMGTGMVDIGMIIGAMIIDMTVKMIAEAETGIMNEKNHGSRLKGRLSAQSEADLVGIKVGK